MSNPEVPNFQQPQAETVPQPTAPVPPAAPAAAQAAPAAPVYQQYQAAPVPQQPAQQAPQAPQVQQATTVGQTNTYALVSILTVMLSPIFGIIFGHLALSQIKRNGDAGRGLALTGVILGYASFALILIFMLTYVSIIGFFFASMGSMMNGYYY